LGDHWRGFSGIDGHFPREAAGSSSDRGVRDDGATGPVTVLDEARMVEKAGRTVAR
jgi:hypothetical protein